MSIRPDPRSLWRADGLGGVEVISVEIDFTEAAAVAAGLVAEGVGHLDVTPNDIPLGAAVDAIAELDDEVMHGRGIRIVRGFPTAPAVAELVLWRVGLELGTAVSQSVLGERLGHVIDMTGTDPNARAYRRNDELSPHTDPGDVLAFLCLQPAAEGGDNQFVSSMTIHEELRHAHPELLERHLRGWRHHRFGEQADGLDPITPYRMPTFSACEGVLSGRYLRQYVEIAHAEDPVGCPLDAVDRAALDAIDELGRDPGLALRVRLKAGEAVFANNHTVMHARRGFTDRPGDPKRHLLRLWIASHTPRPVRAETRLYPGEVGIAAQPGRTPSYPTGVEII